MLLSNHKYLSLFAYFPEAQPLDNKDIVRLDKELDNYEKKLLNPEIETNLISKNELFASFAISKAEDSNLTLDQAKRIYASIKNNKQWNFINKKIEKNEDLTVTDYEKLEYYNIAKIFRKLNSDPFKLEDLNINLLKEIHSELTVGLDIFDKHLMGFDLYYSGNLRKKDNIKVGEYQPSPTKDLEKNIIDLITWLKNDFTITNIGVFHNALYALHPFSNGNKRLCRILEHILFRLIGLNSRNIYSTSYYYHQFKPKYYSRLLASLLKRDLTLFSSFIIESLAMSILGVYKTSIEVQRKQFINDFALDDDKALRILKPLIKEKTISYGNLYKRIKRKMSEQTFINILKELLEKGIIKKEKEGKSVFYSLDISLGEEEIYYKNLKFISSKITKTPLSYGLL
jgi:Fic family protein